MKYSRHNNLYTLAFIALFPLLFSCGKKQATLHPTLESISHLALKKANQVSGGEKQRVAIARALINDPLIIMGDEPTGNLDKKNSDLVFDIFNELSSEYHQTLLIVTHDPSFAERTHRIIHMVDGKIEN